MKKFVKRAISQVIALALAFQIVGQCGYSFAVQADYSSKSEIVTESNADNVSENDVVAQNDENTEEIDEPSEDEIVYEDMTVNSDTTLTAQTEVKDLYINYGTLDLNENTLIVHGNVVIDNRGTLDFNKGELICENLTMKDTYYYHCMYMSNANDHLVVKGDFNFNGGSFSKYDATAGTIELGGNVNITTGFNPSQEQKVVLNGLDSQEVYINEKNCSFNILEVSNTSEGGILSDYPISANSMIGDLSQIHYSFGGAVGTVLSGDMELDNYCLSVGELDLNGHTLIINGDFIQAGGEVKVNSGKLVVNGNYRIQTRKTSEDGTESYDYSTGILNMTNESDTVEVSGDFVMGSTRSHNGKLSAGTMTVGGNFTQLRYNVYDNFAASGSHTIEFNGKIKQNISFASYDDSKFNNIKFNNSNGIALNSRVYAYGNVNDVYKSVCGNEYLYITKLSQTENSSFGGNVYLNNGNNNGDTHLTQNLSVGNLTCYYLHLNGYKLNVNSLSINSNLYVEGGTVECKNNLTLGDCGYLTMTNEKDYVLVGKNLVSNLCYSTSGYLTAGTLEIKVDFTQNENNVFVCSGTHTTILSGKSASNGRIYVQTVKMYNNGSKFNTLVITKPSSFYVAKNQNNTTVSLEDFCNKLIEDYDDIEAPTKITGLTASDVSATSIHIVWEQSTDNIRVTGYEVYRNGEKLITTSRTEFIDESLEPNTSYTYQVYAFDEARNYSSASDKINPKTLADTDSPETPQNVKIKSITGSSLTLSWNASKDNVGTEGYIVYCNNEEIARTDKCEYKHSGLNENEEYSYMIKAYDKAENLSDFSEKVTGSVVMPKITSVTPADLSSLGGKIKLLPLFLIKSV